MPPVARPPLLPGDDPGDEGQDDQEAEGADQSAPSAPRTGAGLAARGQEGTFQRGEGGRMLRRGEQFVSRVETGSPVQGPGVAPEVVPRLGRLRQPPVGTQPLAILLDPLP